MDLELLIVYVGPINKNENNWASYATNLSETEAIDVANQLDLRSGVQGLHKIFLTSEVIKYCDLKHDCGGRVDDYYSCE